MSTTTKEQGKRKEVGDMGEKQAPLREHLERLEFDDQGRVFPCFLYDTHTRVIIRAAHAGLTASVPDTTKPFSELVHCCPSVYRCFGMLGGGGGDDQTFLFTGFFVAPNIMVTTRHSLVEKGKPMGLVLVSLIQSYIPRFRLEENNVRLTVVAEPTQVVTKEPKSGRDMMSSDFVFLRTVGSFKAPSWLYPATITPKIGDDCFAIQYNAQITEVYLEQHKDIAYEPISSGDLNAFLHADRCSVSVGKVNAINDMLLSYTNSTSGGASGAPVFAGSFSTFFAIHRGTLYQQDVVDKDIFDPNVDNVGVCVSDPQFVAMYKAVVVPELQKLGALPQQVLDFLKHHNVDTD